MTLFAYSRVVLLVSAGLCFSSLAIAQEAVDVRDAVDVLFDGMRNGDSTAVRASFLPGASMQSVVASEEGTVIHSDSVDRFVVAVGSPHDKIWDERIYDVKILIDGEMASVWAPYRFYIGEEFSHCGVNQFVLAKQAESWKILNITDTRRKTDCP